MMTRIYTKKPPQPCKVAGCGTPMKARGMCDKHYKAWHRATPVKPSPPDTRQLVLDSLPGTFGEVAAGAGICYDTTLAVVGALHKERAVHIEEWRKAGGVNNSGKYVAVYALGDQEDAKMPSRLDRRKDRRANNRANYHRRKTERAGDPLVNALFGKTQSKGISNASS